MSEENVEIVRAVLGAWNAGEQERIMDLLDPEIVFDASRREVNPRTYVGMDGMRRMLADRDEVWDEFRTEPREFVDAGDRVVVIGDWVGKGKGSGVEVRQPTAHLFTVDGGRISRWELGHSNAEALKAAGLAEAMSEGNVEIWRAQLERQREALSAGASPEDTISEMAEIWDPEVQLDASDAAVLDIKGLYQGVDRVRQFWREWFSAWETIDFDYELVAGGERVVMLLDLKMRGRATGIEMPFGRFAWVSTFRDGLVVQVKLYMSQAEALEAVGLSR